MVRFCIYQLALGFSISVGTPQADLPVVMVIISMVNRVSDQKPSSKCLFLLLLTGYTEGGGIWLEDS